jgi:hypothetical protein
MKSQFMKSQIMKTQFVKSNTVLWISSLLLVAITSCSSGGSTPAPDGDAGPVTTGTLTASFSNPTGSPTIGLTAFSATAGANKSTGVNATVIAGKMGNRLLTLQFSPILTGNRTCTLTTACGIALVENGANAYASPFSISKVDYSADDHTGSRNLRLFQAKKGKWVVVTPSVVSRLFKEIHPGR